MTAPDTEPRTTTEQGGEQAPEDTRSAQPDAVPASPGGKASTAPGEDIQVCASDTIDEGDGNYLEPPD
ncbi:hypothetical protein [Archangium lipolyticum]|uniref:hypothetical protein n=1 Tax=Archangium lipolyticum TaxID=2970465 RepID=UPI00214A534C|nr:hypothetical protein [Archangium lipolyticum]